MARLTARLWRVLTHNINIKECKTMIKRTRKPVRRQTRRFESRGIRRRFNEAEESNVIYTADFADFWSEETTYEGGDIGGGTEWEIRLDLESNTLEGLFDKIQKKLYMYSDDEDYSWSVQLSEMNGWTSFEVNYLGDEQNSPASKRQIEAWKDGDETLWSVYGSVRVKKTVKPSNVPDEEMEAFARANGLDIQ